MKPKKEHEIKARISISLLEREILISGLKHLGEFYTSDRLTTVIGDHAKDYRVSDLIKRLESL